MIGPAANGRFHGNGARGDGYGARYRGDPRKFAAYSLTALWDASVPSSITLNGTDVSAEASLVTGNADVAQATGANQPLYTGAATYNSQRTVTYVAANTDRLQKANTDIIGAGGSTAFVVYFQRGATGRLISNNSGGAGVDLQYNASAVNYQSSGVSARTGGTLAAGSLHVLFARDIPSVTADAFVDGVAVALSAATSARAAPGPTATLSISFSAAPADMDFGVGGFFASYVDTSAVYRMSKAFGARFGTPG